MTKYLTPYLRDKNSNIKENLDLLKYEFDRRIYHYGNHFLISYESNNRTQLDLLKHDLRNFLLDLKINLKSKKEIPPNTIVTNSYFSISQNLDSTAYNFIRPPWDLSLKGELYVSSKCAKEIKNFKSKLNNCFFNQLLDESLHDEIKNISKLLIDFYSNPNIIGAIFPNDVGFFEKLSLNILKSLNKKTILYLHGIPGIYSSNLYSHSDFLFVWGVELKNIFIKNGFDQNKIISVGHPDAAKINSNVSIKNEFKNILVLTYSAMGGQYDDQNILFDRSNSILYLYQIENVLKKLGVNSVSLRPHPSENKIWYTNYINNNFFKLDYSTSINDSLKNKTLVIGPSSSVFTEALINGVNYITFEPFSNHNNQFLPKAFPPFDGSNDKLVFAPNEDELEFKLKNKHLSDISILQDFLGTEFILDKVLDEIFK